MCLVMGEEQHIFMQKVENILVKFWAFGYGVFGIVQEKM